MDLIAEPDIYAPSMDDFGNYIDKLPCFNILQHGISCPCGTRKEKCYDNYTSFRAHCKTKSHQTWLNMLNTNKANFFVDCEKLKETVHTQKLVIANLEKQLFTKNLTVDYLTMQLHERISSQEKEINKEKERETEHPQTSHWLD